MQRPAPRAPYLTFGAPCIGEREIAVVVDGQTGWLCAERSVDELEAALRDAILRPEAIAEYGQHGRRLVEARYDVRHRTLDSIYEQVLS